MPDSSSSQSSSRTSLKKLQSRANLLNALIYLSASFSLATIGYTVYRLISHQVNYVSELVGINRVSLAGFRACLLLATSGLKKTKAEMSELQARGNN